MFFASFSRDWINPEGQKLFGVMVEAVLFSGKDLLSQPEKTVDHQHCTGGFAETIAMLMPQLTGNLAATLNDWHQFRRAAFCFLGVGLVQFLSAVTNDVFERLLKDRLGWDAYHFIHQKLLTMDAAFV